MPAEKDRILVLSVDRDDDIGQKTSLKGPIIGKENVLKAAMQLGLADPEDSDFNALFQAVRVYEDLKKQHDAQVAVVTGHKNVGIQSDKIVSDQLDAMLKKSPADYVVLVTDGTEDEQITPIIQSRVPILSVRRVIVKQSEQLESTYFKIKDFISETLDTPKFSRLVFGLPAIVLILYALFGAEGWRVILGIFGIYLFIKGFKLEKYFVSVADELGSALTRRRFAFFMYIVAAAFAVFATYRGYEVMQGWANMGFFEMASSFVSASVYFYFIALSVAWIGRNVGAKKRRARNVGAVVIFGLAVSIVINSAAQLILDPSVSIMTFMASIVIGFALLFMALLVEWKV